LFEKDPEEPVRLAAAWALGHQRGSRLAQGYEPYDTPPRRIHESRPRYPDDAYRRGVEGTVTVEILIGERGQVAHAEVRESIPELDAAAVECARGWLFEPATRGGKPAPTLAIAPVTFRIH
jgi:protein TonB